MADQTGLIIYIVVEENNYDEWNIIKAFKYLDDASALVATSDYYFTMEVELDEGEDG